MSNTDPATDAPTSTDEDADKATQLSDADIADFEGSSAADESVADDSVPAGDPPADEDPETFDPELLRAVAADDDDGKMIPKPRFDEATGKLKDELRAKTEEVEALRAKLPTTPAAEERDFAAEAEALTAQYDSGEIDDDEYRTQLRAVEREAGRAEGRAAREQEFAAQQREQAAASWQASIKAWEAQHQEFLANGFRRNIVKTLLDEYGKDASLSDAELLAKVEAEAFEAANWIKDNDAPAKPPAPATPAANMHADRDARDARAIARASTAPPAPGGAGNRGNRPGLPASLVGVKGRDYDSLPKELREAKELADF